MTAGHPAQAVGLGSTVTCQSTGAHSVLEALDGWEVQAAPWLHQEHVPLQHLHKTPEEGDESGEARGCDLPQVGTTAHVRSKALSTWLEGDTWEPPSLREPPSCTHPSISRNRDSHPPCPALSSWDTPVLLILERGPRLGTQDRVGAGQKHPAPQHPTALRSLSQLPAPW